MVQGLSCQQLNNMENTFIVVRNKEGKMRPDIICIKYEQKNIKYALHEFKNDFRVHPEDTLVVVNFDSFTPLED